MKAIVNKKSQEFYLPWDDAIARLVGDHHPVRHPKHGKMIALPHKHDVTKLARNMGYTVPAPITQYYTWPGPEPFRTQKITAALLTMNPRAYVLSEMGTGKTRATLFAIDYLIRCGELKKVLVVAPLSTLSNVWDREILEFFPHLSTTIVHGTRRQREKAMHEKKDIYIINHDGPKVIPDLIRDAEFDCIVVDEVGAFRNAQSDRWRCMNQFIPKVKYAWGLTGSPTPQAPTDAYGIAKLLTPSNVPKHFKQFQRQTMTKITQFIWVPLPDANDKVYAALQPAVRYKREDCVELPENVVLERDVQMTSEIEKAYKGMMSKLAIMHEEGKIKAANEGVLFMKLMQLASGWVYTSDRKVVSLKNKPRLDALLEVLDEAEGKVIVFADFTHTAERVHHALCKKKVDAVLVTGATSKKKRDDIFGSFQRYESPRVIVAHPKCMSHGLTLTEANTIVWFTPTTSLETYEQACARITRPGQKRKTATVHLVGSPVEKKLYGRLKRRASTQGALLEMFNDE